MELKSLFIIKNILSEEEECFLKTNFLNVCNSIGVSQKAAESLYDQVHYEYTDWSRHYHNLSHIYSLLRLRERYSECFKNIFLADLAIWFHDIVYNSKRKDNELKSAELFKELMKQYLKKEDLDYVIDLIMSTEKHIPLRPDDNDNLLFLDLDLAILASDNEIYSAYSDAVREEYKSLFSVFVYNSGRKKVLKAFLERETIYYSPLFKENFESIARDNLNREISGL